ncbi:tail fiber protein [Tenacibaculum dicentrarchi]|uniref:tail fiber protein n=1 Tax=Tenacibaculum dicentrarchi TaxID=669041 RepID=UPI000C79D29F|nr:Phage Tail Collar Domain protein [Tenacibaculum dicentrarchi]
MSIKKFTSSILMLISVLSFSQGITVQGIARDPNNNARQNQPITILAELNYLNPISAANVVTYSETITIITDEFGVFSTVLKVPNSIQSILTAHEHYLKISEGSMIISNELLRYVPYAYSAYNGVPSGSIMPYIGVSAPKGWMLCDGRNIPTTDETAILRDLLGASVTPNLNGMFLRGTGTNPVNKQDGPALMNTQNDNFKSHSHNSGTLKTSNNGIHNHSDGQYDKLLRVTGVHTYSGSFDNSRTEPDLLSAKTIKSAGNHNHTISGTTTSTGGNESRPVNFGVNYIIKL